MDRRRLRFAAVLALLAATFASSARGADAIDSRALTQIQALLEEKASRTPAQQKIDSNLLYRIKQDRGEPLAAGISSLETDVAVDVQARALVDITANVQDALLARLRELGAEIESVHREFRAIRARLPLAAIEAVASDAAVIFVQPAQEALFGAAGLPPSARERGAQRKDASGFAGRAARVRAQLAAVLPRQTDALNVSEGDVTHRAKLARTTYGIGGAGLKIGVLSNGVDPLQQVQLSGDLPSDVTILPGQAGTGAEGTAMLEIVHDLAPLAKLYYATASGGVANFANNVHALRTAGCDIIVDDVNYFNETAFQKGQAASVVSNTNGGLPTQAVNDVTADGALYFSSATNSGNLDDATSGTWEGDFLGGGATSSPLPAGVLHDFTGSGGTFETITTGSGSPITISWSDPLGGSGNDYDLFVLNAAGTSIVSSSTNVQNGTQDPFEQVPGGANAAGNRIVIVKHAAAATRALHLATNRSKISAGTTGETHGHNAAAPAFGVAAVDAAGPFPSPFSSSDHVETFSSDGPRKVFFNADSTPITPGNVLFASAGGQVLQKPDIAAADGVSCATPGFNPFFGTSAAAPHSAAIAALVKSAKPSLTPAQIRTALTSTAIDIEAPGVDRDSGVGVLDAMAAVQSIAPTPKALLLLGTTTLVEDGGDGDGFVEPGECGTLTVQLQNENATVGATAISAVLTTSTPGVTVATGSSGYANIAGGAHGNNATPFQISLANTVTCPLAIDFTLTVTFSGGVSPQAYHFLVRAGVPAWNISTTLDTTVPATVPGATSATGLQSPRLNRDGVVASCATPKSFPGTFGSGNRRFDSYTFTNCSASTVCVTVGLTQTSGTAFELFSAAYSPSFNPSSLSTNWVADPGTSGTTQYSFNVPGGATFVVVVNEVDADGGIGANYTLSVDGLCFPCATYTGTCCVAPNATITAPATVCAGSAGNTASVPDAGAGGTYAWTIGNGTITGGNGTRTITFTAGNSGSVNLGVTVVNGTGCSATDDASPAISATGACVSTGKALEADPTDLATSNGNGVFEPGETVVVAPSWKNNSGSAASLTGAASSFTGPSGATYTISDAASSYGSVAAGATASCKTSGDCFQLGITAASRPTPHWDATFHETLSSTASKTWTLHIGSSFTDVPTSEPFYKKIETLLHTGITAGCTATTYCPNDPVSRGAMAIFIAKGLAGGGPSVPASGTIGPNAYDCKAGGASLFPDVLPTDSFCKHVHYISAQNVTAGCAGGGYCPNDTVTRIQMASFIAKALVAPAGGPGVPMTYGPDPVTGFSYSCAAGSPSIHFTDVPATDAFCKHVHFLWAKGIITGCGATTYCPADAVTRDAMAKFLAAAFNLTLYGP
ncbi:MAG TPA: S-layer homology domain-containing protein [Thermoanaerobaculia bacterium]